MADFRWIEAARQGDLDKSGYTALIYAARYGHLEIVSQLIEYGAIINHQTNGGYSALYCASVNNHLSIVSLLIEKGANINIKTNYGNTPLMISAFYGYFSIVSFLLHHGADASLFNKDGETALHLAREKNRRKGIALLEKYQYFHRYRKPWLSFSTSIRSFQEDNQNQNQESKQTQSQSQSQIQSPSLRRLTDSSDLVRYLTEYM